jgi:RNA polymerase sigma-70 factor (ECF subfamily)
MATDERDLVRRCQRGEAGAFEQLCAQHGDLIYRFCYRLCGHVADAEDLTQEVIVAAYQGLDRFAGRSSLRTWLYRIALNRWKHFRGSQQWERVPLEEAVAAITTPDPALGKIEQLSVENALAGLPATLREAFLLVKVEGLKYREAAQVLDLPQGTVQSRVHDAIVRLRTSLADSDAASVLCEDRRRNCSARGRADHAM